MAEPGLVITCEHATNRIPPERTPLFRESGDILDTHAAHDIGAAGLARVLARRFQAPLLLGTVSRLVVDLNRDESSRSVFSRFTRKLDKDGREKLLQSFHRPYRKQALAMVLEAVNKHCPAIHISVHSFTPVLNGAHRTNHIGLLYDPSREYEKRFCLLWKNSFAAREPSMTVRLNYPYRGVSDGLTRSMRRRFPQRYLGIELEVNQSLFAGPDCSALWLEEVVCSSLESAVDSVQDTFGLNCNDLR